MEGTTNPQLRDYCLKKLFSKVPEIKSIKGNLKEELEGHLEKGFGAHLIYEDVFSYYIFDLINKKNKMKIDLDILKRSFELVEELANDKDFEVQCVVQVSFVEPLLAKLRPPSDIEKYLLPKSLHMAQEVGWDRFGLDHRIGWKKAKEWHYPYHKYFGMIANKPEAKDKRLNEIYTQLYSPQDPMPGGIAFMLGKQIKYNKELTLLPKATQLLNEITERITDTKNSLPKSDLETAEVVMHNLRDAIKLADDVKNKRIKIQKLQCKKK